MIFLAVFVGGGIGSACRYGTDSLLKKFTNLPLTTATINTLGSFLLGFIAVLTAGAPLYFLLGTGFCGGFTTFSTAMVEIVKEIRGRRPYWVVFLLLGQILLACCAAFAGMIIGHMLS